MLARLILTVAALLLPTARCPGQHLWWNTEGRDDDTCLYGETTVLATLPGIYYSSAGWWPGEAAGGYCGIQHNSPTERRTIFSIWDTSPTLRPEITAADRRTFFGRFGGEGEGGHTHMIWNWREREAFRFFLQKVPGEKPDTTDAKYYVYEPRRKAWIHSATITSANDGKRSVRTIGGGVNSFLENFAGADKTVPKIALYALWLGPAPDQMRCLTRCGGDGIWGQLGGRYFLAEGDAGKLRAAFARLEKDYGKPVFGVQGKDLPPVADQPLGEAVVAEFKALPRAEAVDNTLYAPEDGRSYTIRCVKSGKGLAVSRTVGGGVVRDNSIPRPVVWRLEKAGDGAFRILNAASGAAIEAAGDAVRVGRRRADVGQVWAFVKAGEGYHIASKRDGRVLDVEGGAEADGARVVVYARHADKPAGNQLWVLTVVKGGK
jgi:hypothetical protein